MSSKTRRSTASRGDSSTKESRLKQSKVAARHPKFSREDIITTVSYRRIRGVTRMLYHIRLAPLETERFRFGICVGKTLSKARAERHADHVAEYIDAWLGGSH